MSAWNPESPTGKDNSSRFYFLFLFLLVVLAAAITLLASVPPISRDALTHHLFVPRLYIEHGGIYEIPTIPFSYYPMNLDLLYMIPLYFSNDILPKYIHFFFALLTTWLIYNYLKNRIPRAYAVLGSLFFLSIPIIVKLSITVYVDLGLMFFTTASLLLLFHWLDSGYAMRYLIFAGLCCGLALGTKYNALISLFLLSLFTPVLYIRSKKNASSSNRKAIGFALLFITAALTAYSPWLIRNYAWTNNPIYPLHDSLFQQTPTNTVAQKTNPEQKQNLSLIEKAKKVAGHGNSVFATRKMLYHETWWQALSLPIRFFFQGQDDDPRYFDGKLNPFLLLLPFFAFLKKSPSRQIQLEKYTLLSFALLFFFFTFFQEALRIRYIVTIVPTLVLLSMFGLHNIVLTVPQIQSPRIKQGISILALSIIIGMLGYNVRYIVQQYSIIQPFSYLRGEISREQYITRFRPEYSSIQFANTILQRDAKVLCIFLGNRGYYMNFNPVFDRPLQGGVFADILKQLPLKKKIKTELLNQSINYILLRKDLTTIWHQHLTKNEQIAVASFFQHDTIKLFSQGGYSFFQIISSPVATQQ